MKVTGEVDANGYRFGPFFWGVGAACNLKIWTVGVQLWRLQVLVQWVNP